MILEKNVAERRTTRGLYTGKRKKLQILYSLNQSKLSAHLFIHTFFCQFPKRWICQVEEVMKGKRSFINERNYYKNFIKKKKQVYIGSWTRWLIISKIYEMQPWENEDGLKNWARVHLKMGLELFQTLARMYARSSFSWMLD